MADVKDSDFQRPYLVIPKLVEQPTWGGQYIVNTKGWIGRPGLSEIKIGQSYELFSGSNLSLLESTLDPLFIGELTNRDAVKHPTSPINSVPLAKFLRESPEDILGRVIVNHKGPYLNMLIKYTQALGNSFQVHIKSGEKHQVWEPKPESWYYFEHGLITLGVKPNVDWQAYESAVTNFDNEMKVLGAKIKDGDMSYDEAQTHVQRLIERYDPWQYVNTVAVEKDQIIDSSGGGIHHSWEEDAENIPLGNVLLELQSEALDGVSTFRNFDKGKMTPDGSVRQLHIKEYFQYIDRSLEANDPSLHVLKAKLLKSSEDYQLECLLRTQFYSMDRLTFSAGRGSYTEDLDRYKHLFVKSGHIDVSTKDYLVTVTAGHSCFVPAAAGQFIINNQSENSEIIISYSG